MLVVVTEDVLTDDEVLLLDVATLLAVLVLIEDVFVVTVIFG